MGHAQPRNARQGYKEPTIWNPGRELALEPDLQHLDLKTELVKTPSLQDFVMMPWVDDEQYPFPLKINTISVYISSSNQVLSPFKAVTHLLNCHAVNLQNMQTVCWPAQELLNSWGKNEGVGLWELPAVLTTLRARSFHLEATHQYLSTFVETDSS